MKSHKDIRQNQHGSSKNPSEGQSTFGVKNINCYAVVTTNQLQKMSKSNSEVLEYCNFDGS